MIRQPKSLGDHELEIIALKIRGRLIEMFGKDRVISLLTQDQDVGMELLRQTYIAVREQLEQEAL